MANFYPRPPRGGRPGPNGSKPPAGQISIHALREEGDIRRASIDPNIAISIHALREEGDARRHQTVINVYDFYPRPPRGGRQAKTTTTHGARAFLSTPSARRATMASVALMVRHMDFYPRPPRGGRLYYGFGICAVEGISIHALREEGDLFRPRRSPSGRYFYPRPPRGGRLVLLFSDTIGLYISIHALREEGDLAVRTIRHPLINFYPRPPRGGRRRPWSCRSAPA